MIQGTSVNADLTQFVVVHADDLAWAALIWLSILGILMFLAVVWAERIIMPWGVGGHL